ncbi:NAD(P)/FAD-dependent oxidoreductase [Burkholderia lata]|uniref:FAD dependent oxidoreductase n=1 Tax=Burkholderia lata (strain ATCC 17760 / DSM 23089 / LMG 22485 / NCIMB 9086 / R18194 / 383) TaxID=482957 RepID=A0A6P2XJF3_BURL3|nr:FAD-binding oxidoreductase [Burkholderia lata]VWD09962.1 FAD dependent oxidoreductase [Burkholderia lata]
MGNNSLRVVVIGGGIIGASTAWHLARSGAQVTLLEQQAMPAGGATHWSFGWVGTGSALPSDDPSGFSRTLGALPEFARLERELGSLPVTTRGALVWLDSDAQTAALIDEQRAAGVRMDALGRREVARMEPRLARLPELIAWAPDDFVVEPIDLTHQLLAGAQAAGAEIRCGCAVEAVETRNGHAVGVHTAHGPVPADVVVLTNAASAAVIAAGLGVSLPVREKPAVLMRFAAGPGLISHLLYGRDLEVRIGPSGSLLSAADPPEEGDSGLAALAARTASDISGLFAEPPPLTLLSAKSALRPMTNDRAPINGFLAGVAGVYAVVGHPGVILAPQLGRLAASAIMGA